MRYVSTRGEAPVLNFEEVMMAGLASDGGLYLPESWPQFSTQELTTLQGASYADVAFAVIAKFTGHSIPEADLRQMIAAAYGTFGHQAVAPLRQMQSNLWLMELFHGPTLAFKDVAMQLLARLMDWSLTKHNRHATIIGATSGDTGGAAVDAFKSNARTHTFILHPHGRVSNVQRRQMTTVNQPNIHNIAIEGDFDDCQAIVKALFNDAAFREQVSLSGVNSINWARIMIQIVYYVTSALALDAPRRSISYSVPTGNFGDIFAGYAARNMGVPIDQLVIATNVNDILDRTLKTGRYELRGVTPSSSPSMDIQVSSNFERLLYLACNRTPETVRGLMNSLQQSGNFTIAEQPLQALRREFASEAVSEAEVAATIAAVLQSTGELIDTHTAVGYAAALRHLGHSPMVALATAHPAKFPDAVQAASGVTPYLPPRLSHLLKAQEHFIIAPNSATAVRDIILQSADKAI